MLQLRYRRAFFIPVVELLLLVAATVCLPLYGARAFNAFDAYNALQVVAGPGLLALGLGLTMVAGEFDLSTLGMYALGGMLAVKLGVDQPVVGVVIACLAGILVGVIQGFTVARTGINSMALTLGGYVALIGLTGVLGHDESVSYTNFGAGAWLDQVVFEVVSPRSLVTIGAFVFFALVLWVSPFGRDLRAIGSDRQASRSAGVSVDAVLMAVFGVSGLLSALGGALVAYSSATATPSVGLSPLIFAVTAVLLGGVSLSGGVGGAISIAAGVATLGLLYQIFAIQGTSSYIASIVVGGLLLIVVLVDARGVQGLVARARARLASAGREIESG